MPSRFVAPSIKMTSWMSSGESWLPLLAGLKLLDSKGIRLFQDISVLLSNRTLFVCVGTGCTEMALGSIREKGLPQCYVQGTMISS